jgi:dTDP-4-dehydrorhamnose 3,5-epimerase
MIFHDTEVAGCFLVEPEPRADERGFFARIFDSAIFQEKGLADRFVQFNNSLSVGAGTLRGLHYQIAPFGEDKLVRCIAGAAYDVVLDLRKCSPTFERWASAELSAENRRLMYAPKGCAHGFLTLLDNTELIYFVSGSYVEMSERIVRWDDPAFGIRWPRNPSVLSDKDRTALDYNPTWYSSGY